MTTNKDQSLSIVLYLAKDRESDTIKVLHSDANSLQIEGQSKYIGNFSFNIKVDYSKSDVLYTGYLDTQSSLAVSAKTLKSNLKPQNINGTEIFVVHSNGSRDDSSFIAFQVVIQSETQIEMHFQLKNQTNVTDISYENELKKRIENFGNEFEQKFSLSKKNFSDLEVDFAKSTLSEMLGSIGYFYGQYIYLKRILYRIEILSYIDVY